MLWLQAEGSHGGAEGIFHHGEHGGHGGADIQKVERRVIGSWLMQDPRGLVVILAFAAWRLCVRFCWFFIRGDSRDSRVGAGTAAECRGYKAEGLSRWRGDTEGGGFFNREWRMMAANGNPGGGL